jgi:hypothetical protein
MIDANISGCRVVDGRFCEGLLCGDGHRTWWLEQIRGCKTGGCEGIIGNSHEAVHYRSV